MTVREALGGPWASHWLFLVALLPPTTLLVLLREIVTPYPEWWWPLASAFAQHIVVGAVIVLGGAIARRRHAVIPLATVFAIWTLAAVLRGVVAGAIAEIVAGVDPEYATRIGVWMLVSIVWLPAMVYATAQFEHRRQLLGALDFADNELTREQQLVNQSSADRQRQLRHAVAELLTPTLNDLQNSLEASRDGLDRATVAELSLRLSQLHDNAADLLAPPPGPMEVLPPPRASLRRAIDMPPRRPWLTALLVGWATISLVSLDAWRIFGSLAAIEVVVSTTVATVAMGAVLASVGAFWPTALARRGQRITVAAITLGIVVAIILMLNSGIDPITSQGLLIVPLLAIAFVVASVTVFSAIVLADANAEAAARLGAVSAELTVVRELSGQREQRERHRLSDLMHGPVQGRIAACVMALNFSSTSDLDDDQARFLTDSVLGHLRDVSRDLRRITEGLGR